MQSNQQMDFMGSMKAAEIDPLGCKKGSADNNSSPRDDGCHPHVDGDYERWTIPAFFHPSDDSRSDISEDIVVPKAEEGLVVLGDPPPPSRPPTSATDVLMAFRAGMLSCDCCVNFPHVDDSLWSMTRRTDFPTFPRFPIPGQLS